MNTLDTNNYINHIGLVIDNSSSMSGLKQEVIKVTDAQIAYLAQRSKDLDQETRATTYLFDDVIRCANFDKDVLRLPSLAQFYKPTGMTALIDATFKCIEDLEQTAQLYADHAFLIFVVTDGQENKSRRHYQDLAKKISSLPENWTIAVLVPNAIGIHEAKRFGFPAQNISVWDATNSQGFIEAGKTIQRATENWMQGRAKGIRGSTNIFSLDVSKLTKANVSSLQRVNQYKLLDVESESVIRPFVEAKTGSYLTGSCYYMITKPETVQASKHICLRDKMNGAVFTGPQARHLLGLPNSNARVKPSECKQYDIYVQSTSTNRKLVAGTKVLILT